jgi:hypothetical protein
MHRTAGRSDISGDDSEVRLNTTGDGEVDSGVVRQAGTHDLSKMSVVINNPEAWPNVACLRPVCRKIVLSVWFDHFIALVIVVNACIMAASTYPQNCNDCLTWLNANLKEHLDYIFVAIYTLEVVVKILGIGVRPYFWVPFHDLDFFVVLCSLVSLLFPRAKGATASRIVRLILRVIRMLRLLKLVSKVDTVV